MMLEVRFDYEDPVPSATPGTAMVHTVHAIDVSTGERIPGMRGNGDRRGSARYQLVNALDKKYPGDWRETSPGHPLD